MALMSLLATAAVICGCGGGGSSTEAVPLGPAPKPETGQAAKSSETAVPSSVLSVSSPAFKGGTASDPGKIVGKYVCANSQKSPPVKWSGIKPGTRELMLFVMNLAPVDGKLFVDWAVAGIDPDLNELRPDKLPGGAVVGLNSSGKAAFSLCPPGKKSETFVLALYALSEAVKPQPGFDAVDVRAEALEAAGQEGLTTFAAS
ncbi:MAG: hypothetical protein JST53_18000 [Actinobacteria bacterium]|nr:hypothetical protein [Actinomycetota bacterium]